MTFPLRLLEPPVTGHSPDMLDGYYSGAQRLSALGVSLPPSVRVLELAVNWPRLVVDSLAERMIVEGFRLAGSDKTDAQCWDIWQANQLDAESVLAHTDAFVQGAAYIIVGARQGTDMPAVTIVSRRGMHVKTDPLTREVIEAGRRYKNAAGRDSFAHYLPDRTDYYVKLASGWDKYDTYNHKLGVVPVVPLVNRARLDDRHGRSEMADVMPLTDAAARTLTNLQVAQELLALPQRYVIGADASDFTDSDGEAIPKWQVYIGHLLTLPQGAELGQLSGADLRMFSDSMNLYARQVSAVSGLPAHFLGFTSENPASAEAIAASEAKLIMRVEQRMIAFGEAWEQAMRIAVAMFTNSAVSADRLEIVWRNPATPTIAAKMDAAIKGTASGLLTMDQGREMIGMSPEQRAIAAESDRAGGFLPGAA